METLEDVRYSAPTESRLSRGNVWSLAETVAQKIGLAVGAPLEPLIEKMGGKIEFRDVDELNTSGAIVIKAEKDFTIFLPLHTGAKRDRFTVGHELGHYFLHYKLPTVQGQGPTLPMRVSRYGSDRTETEANWFAAAFLMPEKSFRESFQQNRGNVIAVADEFDVSRAAAGIRAASLNLSEFALSTDGFRF
jgi:Zn-dependent peptidase ImmA (M78 family)